ncbi:CtsR family transcriptional regulator [Gemella sp. GH3]|uniref:CtsR family transcriptional regulator n=1 Tax=unclassified Gemella TaxID=2624949 RepID=UPI0015D04C0A|nr:CtsR family transcriptional regulator [Gemella sp. GH3.1]NYS50812.1 CtsR family transcriptional regulator [Gemella sp. GH3]
MNNMTDIIEQYIKELLNNSDKDFITLKRSNVAEKFDCVPSQLNYVIKTRFTPEHGFTIESKRGGGGFIRITKITIHNNADYLDYLVETIKNETLENIDYLKILKILKNDNYINYFDFEIMGIAFSRLLLNYKNLEKYILDEDDLKNARKEIFENMREMLIDFLTTIKYSKGNK